MASSSSHGQNKPISTTLKMKLPKLNHAAVSNEAVKLPLKRRSECHLPYHVTPTLAKKQANDETLLEEKFGHVTLSSASIGNVSGKMPGKMDGYSFYYLRKNIRFVMKDGEELNCHVTSNGALAIYSPPRNDMELLNKLLHFLMKKFNIGAHTTVELDLDAEVFYCRPDRLSTFWDKDAKSLEALPRLFFRGKIAVKIMGIFLFQEPNVNVAPKAKLLIHLEQVKVMEAGNGEDDVPKTCFL